MRRQNTKQKKEILTFLCHFKIIKYLLDKNLRTIHVLNQKRLKKNSVKLDCLFLMNNVKSLTRFTDFSISCVQFRIFLSACTPTLHHRYFSLSLVYIQN
jgi:hypothetical protein